jgi:hypothetical protein
MKTKILNSTFKRICNFVEKSGFKIRNLGYGFTFYFHPDAKVFNYTWMWKNKKDLMLGYRINNYDIESSLFSLLIKRYEHIKRYNINNPELISENTSDFINMCRFLEGCNSIEELVLKMDLMDI